MNNFEEQMRQFEAELAQGLRPPTTANKPSFVPSSIVRNNAPVSFSKPAMVHSAPAKVTKPSNDDDEEDVFAKLLKYEKEVRAEKREKKHSDKDKEKKKAKKEKEKEKEDAPAPGVVASAAPHRSTTVFNGSAQPSAAVAIKPGTQVTPDEIKLKAKQMVELVRATQVIQTKRLPPTQGASSSKTSSDYKEVKASKKPKKMIRVAGGEVWEDKTLLDWDINDFRLFCGDLGNDVTDQVLTRTFSRYPSFQMAKVIRDKRSNKTKGYGFVSFKDPSDFTRAIKEMNGQFVGSRPIKLSKSNWKDRNVDIVKSKQKLKHKMGYKY